LVLTVSPVAVPQVKGIAFDIADRLGAPAVDGVRPRRIVLPIRRDPHQRLLQILRAPAERGDDHPVSAPNRTVVQPATDVPELATGGKAKAEIKFLPVSAVGSLLGDR